MLPAAEVVRVLKRLSRALAAIHELGGAHGAISPRTVVIDDSGVPTVMIAGLGPIGERPPEPGDDVTAVIALLAQLAGIDDKSPSFLSLSKKLVDEVDAPLPDPLATAASPVDGESLYAVADVLDIAVLGALGSR